MDTPYVREYLEDRELTAWLLLDRSPSMGFGTDDATKETRAHRGGATLASCSTRRGNRVGAILYNNEVERTIPPGRPQAGAAARPRDLHAARADAQPAPPPT